MMQPLTALRRVIVYGGTFDPPQVAHVTLPRQAMVHVRADVVLYVPAGVSPLKQDDPPTDPAHRLAMLKLALAKQPHAMISPVEINRDPSKPSYTIDTISELKKQLGPTARLWLLIGSDQALQLDKWHRINEILALASPLVMVRPPDEPENLLEQLPDVMPRSQWAGSLVPTDPLPVSASQIRDMVAKGQSVSDLTPPAVADYIQKHGLYQGET